MTNLSVFSNSGMTISVAPLVGGGQPGAGQLNPGFNSIQNPANAFDSIQLPAATSGTIVVGIIEFIQTDFTALFSMNGTSDTINGQSNDALFFFPSQPSPWWTLICVCAEDGVWSCNVTNTPPE